MPAKKRTAPESPIAPGRRRSTRASSSHQKSRYFESDPDDDADDADELGEGAADGLKAPSGKKRGRPAKKPIATQRKSTGKRAKIEHDDNDTEDFKEDVEDYDDEDDEDNDLDEDEMPQVTIIPLIKMRDTGGVDYEDDRLHKNTMLFLKDLKANNERDWLKCKPFVFESSNIDLHSVG